LIAVVGALVLVGPSRDAQGASFQGADPRRQESASVGSTPDPEQIFRHGEEAPRGGDLDQAERNFRQVVILNPQVAGAYANLGVIYMRRKQWTPALANLHKAEKLAPKVAGIRLNIGLTHYRQNEFRRAIPPFESVVKDQPDSLQARFLLGQCYFFTERWGDAVDTLEPLWPQQSDQLNYLYVLGIAADKAERKELGERALTRLVEVGQDSAELHLLLGKAKLNEEAYDDALKELTAAAEADPCAS